MKRDHAERVFFEQLKRTVPIEAVLAKYGIELTRKGLNLVGCCPIHKGSNKRQFVVSNNLWRCFSPSCDRGGDVLALVAELEKIEVKNAALLVADWFCIKPGSGVHHRKPKEKVLTIGATPSHKVFLVEDRGESKDPFWHRVGSAWPSKDGGFQVQLPPGLAVSGRVVLRPYTAEDHEEDNKAKRKK